MTIARPNPTKVSPNRGRRSKNFERLKQNLRMQRRPCWLCGQPIDYSIPSGDPQSFTVDHIKTLSANPALAEDPANLAAAHKLCNDTRNKRDPKPGLGDARGQW